MGNYVVGQYPIPIVNKEESKVETCQKCVVYKQTCGDEIGELTEVFNQMVTDLRVNLKKLEKANMEKCRLERLSLLGQMSARVAHEIKNPLNAIKGAANYLKRNFEGEILQEFLRIIEEETERLNDIVSDFLNFSKPTPPVKVLSNLNLLVEDTVQLVDGEIREKRLNLVLDTDSSLKPFKFDYAKLKQALLNLLVNAIEETEPGGVIEVKTQRKDSYVLLSVRDSGRGIAPEVLEHVFKPFFTTKTRGSGLGLAIVEQIVKEHEGEISVESVVDKGSIFTITLPVEEK